MTRKPYEVALWAALPMAHTPRIEGRLKMILDRTRSRRALNRWTVGLALGLTSGLALMVATAGTPPHSLAAAITSSGYPADSPTHVEANISFLKTQIQRFGDKDAWAGKAYYVLGNSQMAAGRYGDALASYDKAAALPEPPYAGSGIHSSARYERINTLDAAGRYAEAAAETEILLKGGGRGLVAASLWENLRERLPEFRFMRDDAANRAAEQGQYRALASDPRWTRTLADGVTVHLLGVMSSTGNRHTIWSPEGRRLSTAEYKSLLGGGGFQGPTSTKEIGMILRFSYPVGRTILTGYALSGAMGTGFQSGLARSSGVVMTDEEKMNPEIAGRRTVQAWFPPTQAQTDLRVSIALVTPPAGPSDPPDVPKEWAEFAGVTLPPVESPQWGQIQEDQP